MLPYIGQKTSFARRPDHIKRGIVMRLFCGTMLFVFLGVGNVYADMVAVSANLADIRSSPSMVVSTVLLQVPLYYPLSTQGAQDDFLKVVDYQGNIGWIQKTSVNNVRSIVVKKKKVNVRKGPGTKYSIVFKAQDGVVFKVLGEKGNWLEVEHETGAKGWLFKDLVWGN